MDEPKTTELLTVSKSDGKNYLFDLRGKFAKGTRGGPGAPCARYARQTAERFDDAIFKVCTADRLLEMMDAIMRQAQEGDVRCAEFIKTVGLDRDIIGRMERLEALFYQVCPTVQP